MSGDGWTGVPTRRSKRHAKHLGDSKLQEGDLEGRKEGTRSIK